MKRIFLSIIFLLISSTAHADIVTGLVGWWKLDDGSGSSAVDSSGSNYTGSLVNAPSWVTGQIGPYALSLSHASGQYVHVPDLPVTGYPFTITAWFKVSSNTSGTIASLNAGAVSGSGNSRYELYYNNNQVCIYTQDGIGDFDFPCGGSISTGVWYQFTGVFASTSSFLVYLNGSPITSGSTGCSFSSPIEFDIGVDSAAVNYFDGTIDDVRIYNRALSLGDISELYSYTGKSFPQNAIYFGNDF